MLFLVKKISEGDWEMVDGATKRHGQGQHNETHAFSDIASSFILSQELTQMVVTHTRENGKMT